MISSLLATFASTIGYLVLRVALSTQSGSNGTSIYLIVLSSFFFLSFLNFAITIRSFLYCGYLMTAKMIDPIIWDYINVEHNKRNPRLKPRPQLNSTTEEGMDIQHLRNLNIDRWRLKHIKNAERSMKRATVHFFLGIRCIYPIIILVIGLIDSWAFLAGSIVIVLFSYYSDHSV